MFHIFFIINKPFCQISFISFTDYFNFNFLIAENYYTETLHSISYISKKQLLQKIKIKYFIHFHTRIITYQLFPSPNIKTFAKFIKFAQLNYSPTSRFLARFCTIKGVVRSTFRSSRGLSLGASAAMGKSEGTSP